MPPNSWTAWSATHSPASTAVFLAKHTSAIRFGLAGQLALAPRPRAYTRATSMRRAISASVFCTACREISGRPNVSRSRHHCDGEVEAALRARIRLRGKADALG